MIVNPKVEIRPNYWVVVPAAGKGTRMGESIPKQYMDLCGKPVILQTLNRLRKLTFVKKIVVAVAADDAHFKNLELHKDTSLLITQGGNERHNSVLNCLRVIENQIHPKDWVLVHDAARPCVRVSDIEKLVYELKDDPVGGLLGLPVRDTLKAVNSSGEITSTIDRSNLWHAFTPQMFRFSVLKKAIERAIESGEAVTDEASAIELLGLGPRLILGNSDNIKITHPRDLPLASFYLTTQLAESCA